jgi:hypothetical protein
MIDSHKSVKTGKKMLCKYYIILTYNVVLTKKYSGTSVIPKIIQDPTSELV